MPNYSKRTRAHGRGAAEMHCGASPGVPGTQQEGGTRACVHLSVQSLYTCLVSWKLTTLEQDLFCTFILIRATCPAPF